MTNETLLLINAESAQIVVKQILAEICQRLHTGLTDRPQETMSLQGAANRTQLNASARGEGTQRPAKLPLDEPFARYMQTMGFDPNDGCVLYVPETLRWKPKPNSIPQYVDFVSFTDDLILLRNP